MRIASRLKCFTVQVALGSAMWPNFRHEKPDPACWVGFSQWKGQAARLPSFK